MDSSSFLAGIHGLEALEENRTSGLKPKYVRTSQSINGNLTDLLALKVSPHSSLAADGQASAVQHGQHKGREGNEEKGDNSKYDGHGFLPVGKDRRRGRNST